MSEQTTEVLFAHVSRQFHQGKIQQGGKEHSLNSTCHDLGMRSAG